MVRQKRLTVLFQSLAVSTILLMGLSQALPLTNVVPDKAQEAHTLYNRAYLERNSGNFDTALTHIQDAIAIVEHLRTKIPSQELRLSYFATVEDYYHFYIDLLMQLHWQNPDKGYDAQALEISDRTRARTLLEHLIEAGANIRSGADPKLLEQERNLQQQLNTINSQKYQLLTRQHTQQEINEFQQKIPNIKLFTLLLIPYSILSTLNCQELSYLYMTETARLKMVFCTFIKFLIGTCQQNWWY